MSYRVKRGKIDDGQIFKVHWCKLHTSEYWDKCWAAYAGRVFLPIMCRKCEFFIRGVWKINAE